MPVITEMILLTLVHPYGHFCPFQFCFFDHFACVKANCKNLAQVCIFIGIVLFHRHFLKKNIFGIWYKKILPLSAFWTKMSPLKPIKTAIFNPRFS